MMKRPGSEFTKDVLPVINNAVLGACDAQDGVKDGYLTDPTKCKFDPASLVCKPGQEAGKGCISENQAAAVNLIYKGSSFYPGTTRGGEITIQASRSSSSVLQSMHSVAVGRASRRCTPISIPSTVATCSIGSPTVAV